MQINDKMCVKNICIRLCNLSFAQPEGDLDQTCSLVIILTTVLSKRGQEGREGRIDRCRQVIMGIWTAKKKKSRGKYTLVRIVTHALCSTILSTWRWVQSYPWICSTLQWRRNSLPSALFTSSLTHPPVPSSSPFIRLPCQLLSLDAQSSRGALLMLLWGFSVVCLLISPLSHHSAPLISFLSFHLHISIFPAMCK